MKNQFIPPLNPKRNSRIGFIAIVLFLIVSCNSGFGQTKPLDSIAFNNVITNTVGLYNNAAGSQSGIYKGFDYQYDRINIGHAFFDTTYLVKGNIVYDDILYKDIPMLYDIVRDVVVTQNFNKLHLTFLANEHVSRFTFLEQTFIRISADTLKGAPLKSGFYQLLYNGRIKAWVKNRKVIEEIIDNDPTAKKTAVEKKQWYIYKRGNYFEVDGKKAMLRVFQDKKKEMQQYMRKHKIHFKNHMDNALVRVASYYDEITNE